MDAKEPLLTENTEIKNRYTMFPVEYSDVFEMYKLAQSVYWTADEINFAQDITDLEKLNNNEKFFINHVLAFFAASDGIVMENLSERFSKDIPKAEVRAFYAFQNAMEAVHCVAPETCILTKKGYECIKNLRDQQVEVWNGECWSQVTVKKTSDNSKLVNVKLSNGMNLECTLGHKWFVRVGNRAHPEQCKITKIETKDLREGDIIAAYELPIVLGQDPDHFQNPYTHGFFCGDGTYANNYPYIPFYSPDKIALIPYMQVSSQNYDPRGVVKCYLTNCINKAKFVVPVNYSVETKLRWLEGYLDADGCIHKSTKNQHTSIQVTSVNLEFLKNVQLLLSTLGVHTNIKFVREEGDRMLPDGHGGLKEYHCNEIYCLYITCKAVQDLRKLGFQPKRLCLSTDEEVNGNPRLIEVTAIEDTGRMDETYCFTEPLRHAGVFNGILTGQSETYSLLIDTYVKDDIVKDELFNAVRNYPAIREKASWAIKWIEDKNASFAQRLVAFAIVEGVFFSASFCAIFWLRERGLLPGLSFANQLIARDENQHTEFAILLYSKLINRLPEETVHAMFREAVEIETRFITESISCAMIGMNTTLMTDYIMFVADRLLVLLGYNKIFNKANPFAFMEKSAVEAKTNFFEQRTAMYAKASVQIKQTTTGAPSELAIDLENF